MDGVYDGISHSELAIDCFLHVVNSCFNRGLTEQDIEESFFPHDAVEEEASLAHLGVSSSAKGGVRRGSVFPGFGAMLRKGNQKMDTVVQDEEMGPKEDRRFRIGVNDFSKCVLKLAGKSYAPSKADVEDIVSTIQRAMGGAGEAEVGLEAKTLMGFLEKEVFLKQSAKRRSNSLKKSKSALGLEIEVGRGRDEDDVIDEEMAQRWGIMYCGGARPVEATIREVGVKHRIEFRIESFGW